MEVSNVLLTTGGVGHGLPGARTLWVESFSDLPGYHEFRYARLGLRSREAGRIVKVFRDAGGNFFDTADVYGGGASEEILGTLLRSERDEVVIATKVGLPTGVDANARGTSAKHIQTAVEGSLRRLGVDYIDLYQVHHFDHHVPLEETMGALERLVNAGKVRYIGSSNFYAWQIADAANVALHSGSAHSSPLK